MEQPQRPRLGRAVPVLFVRDVVASARFFRDTLGFSIDFVHGEPPFYGSVSRDNASLHLKFVHGPVLAASPDDSDGLISAFIQVDCVDELYAELAAAGATFQQGLTEEAWGGRDFVVHDLDGNGICFARSPA